VHERRQTTIRPATDDDAERLAAWHSVLEVARYWDGDTFTPAEIRARLRRPTVDAFIVEEDGEPVGYLQAWWEDDEPRRGGLDGFLIPSARGRGVMPAAARQLAERLVAAGWEEVTVDPYTWNDRAIRGWANAGFVEVSRDEKVVLMRFRG
jgi:RimJ/RimL family protein N-acetyltransferase